MKIRSPAHLTFIRSLPCAICHQPGSQAHHLLRAPGKGMGTKAGDDWTIPLCPRHHAELHQDGNEPRYLEAHEINGRALAQELWAVTGNHNDAAAVMLRMKG